MIPERITKFFNKDDGIMKLNMNFSSYISLHL